MEIPPKLLCKVPCTYNNKMLFIVMFYSTLGIEIVQKVGVSSVDRKEVLVCMVKKTKSSKRLGKEWKICDVQCSSSIVRIQISKDGLSCQ